MLNKRINTSIVLVVSVKVTTGSWKRAYCWKFHFWNLNGYSDLSAVEGIAGKERQSPQTTESCGLAKLTPFRKNNNKKRNDINKRISDTSGLFPLSLFKLVQTKYRL